jgi:signal transduction histidine kinase
VQRQGDENLTVRIDAALLQHVILNVVANALGAFHDEQQRQELAREAGQSEVSPSPARTILRISVLGAPNKVCICILNNGPPITLPHPERIFVKGFTTRPRNIGHGLGLYICRLIMTYLGGEIDLLDAADRDADMTVGFRIGLPMTGRSAGDLLGEA